MSLLKTGLIKSLLTKCAWQWLFTYMMVFMNYYQTNSVKSFGAKFAVIWLGYGSCWMNLIMNFQITCIFEPFKTFRTWKRLFILVTFLMIFHIMLKSGPKSTILAGKWFFTSMKQIMSFQHMDFLEDFWTFFARIQLFSYTVLFENLSFFCFHSAIRFKRYDFFLLFYRFEILHVFNGSIFNWREFIVNIRSQPFFYRTCFKINRYFNGKGQLISECSFAVFKFPKRQQIFCKNSCPSL